MKIAIVGATGEVGRMMLTCLQEHKVPVNDLSLFASSRSAGEQLFYEDRPITVRELDENSLTNPMITCCSQPAAVWPRALPSQPGLAAW